MSDIVRAALVQSEWTGDKTSMVDKNVDLARHAADQGAQVLCFQEIFNTSYFCNVQDSSYYDAAEEIPDGPTMQRMIKLSEKNPVGDVPAGEERGESKFGEHDQFDATLGRFPEKRHQSLHNLFT